jgi:uncharacterized membrane protein YcaP (DUF421 family)
MIAEVFESILTAIISVVVMFILTKLIGNRAISQMNMFDYINSITIGSIASELAVSEPKDIVQPLVAMIVYAGAVIALAVVTGKSLILRRFVEGRCILLMENGKLIYRNFKKAKIDVNEFLMQCRPQGYFDLSEIDSAVAEANGRISILPYSAKIPTSADDLKVVAQQESLFSNIILNGKILKGNIKRLGFNEPWLESKLKQDREKGIDEIFLGTADKEGEVRFYLKSKRRDKSDKFDI